MPCRDEMSKRISLAFAVTERKVNRTLREKYIDVRDLRGTEQQRRNATHIRRFIIRVRKRPYKADNTHPFEQSTGRAYRVR